MLYDPRDASNWTEHCVIQWLTRLINEASLTDDADFTSEYAISLWEI